MTKIKLNLNYNLNFPNGEKPENIDKEYTELSKGYIEYAVTASHPKGLNGGERRTYGRIQTLIEKSMEDKTYEILLEENDYIFLREAFENKETKFNATLSRYVVLLEDEIFKVV